MALQPPSTLRRNFQGPYIETPRAPAPRWIVVVEAPIMATLGPDENGPSQPNSS